MIGGRSGWLAWPVGVVCAGVIAGLAWMAAPGVPTAVSFVGDLLRAGASAPEAGGRAAESVEHIGTALTDDCRSLYPDGLWVELSWTPHVLLAQTQATPTTSVSSVVDALSPRVRMTCVWRDASGRTISTSLSDVHPSAAAIARAAFGSQGFSCADSGDGIRCDRTAGDVVEEHVVRDGVWLATVETGWHPDRYTDRLVARLWP